MTYLEASQRFINSDTSRDSRDDGCDIFLTPRAARPSALIAIDDDLTRNAIVAVKDASWPAVSEFVRTYRVPRLPIESAVATVICTLPAAISTKAHRLCDRHTRARRRASAFLRARELIDPIEGGRRMQPGAFLNTMGNRAESIIGLIAILHTSRDVQAVPEELSSRARVSKLIAPGD